MHPAGGIDAIVNIELRNNKIKILLSLISIFSPTYLIACIAAEASVAAGDFCGAVAAFFAGLLSSFCLQAE
jgi:hypothetical protein